MQHCSTIRSHQGSIKEEPIDIDGFGPPPNSVRNRNHSSNFSGTTFHMNLNNINQDVIELSSSDSEDENTSSYDDSNKQLVLYDPSVNGGSEIVPCPEPFSYQHASFPRDCFQNHTRVLPSVGAFTVQCANCFKWRLVPNQEKYEEIREHITQNPFVCANALEWRPNVSCDDPPDIEQDGSRLWAIDKPNIAQPPPGWQRDLRIRVEGGSKFADMYLFKHSEFVAQGVTTAQFSFLTPKPLQENYVRKEKYVKKRPAGLAASHDGNCMGLPGSFEASSGTYQNTDLQLGMPGFSTTVPLDLILPSPKKPRSSPAKHRHNTMVSSSGV